MQDLVKKLHGKMAELEEEVYDWEFKLRRQEFEVCPFRLSTYLFYYFIDILPVAIKIELNIFLTF